MIRSALLAGPLPGFGRPAFSIYSRRVDAAAIVISGIALVVSLVGTYLGDRRAKASNALAQQALDDTHRAEIRALWSDAIEAVHRVLIDPTTEPIGDKLQTLRVRLVALVDGLPGWSGLDRWLTAEHQLGVALGREVMETARPGLGVEGQMRLLSRHLDWGAALAQNMRHLRNIGYSPEDIDGLRTQAVQALSAVYQRHDWGPLPSELTPGPG